ncbi:TIGR04283 family arsenosugar biosynthesis glycosyltransferase [Roseivirga sp.]|uniref:TIGR04283 family arsenosugar biosynthesis glycosyltransferase n=1 Tax=Roseivirga sp. TaxID=1964215 RepID=UPI003B8CA9DC
MVTVSIIIPTYNEASCIEAVLHHIDQLEPAPHEIIIVDGGSSDNTKHLIAAHQFRLIDSPKLGRAAQMDLGAKKASGEILCFLHADTYPPLDLVNIVQETLSDEVVLAGFRSIMQGSCNQRMTSFHNRVKTYYAPFIYNPYRASFKGLRLLFGDQLMFCKKEDYTRSGGFNTEMEIMEEADLCIKMNRIGRIKQIDHKVYSSDRRVAKWGVLKSNIIFITIATLWALGVPNKKLARIYTHIR